MRGFPFWSKATTDLKIPPVLRALNTFKKSSLITEAGTDCHVPYVLKRTPKGHTDLASHQSCRRALSAAEKGMLVKTTATLDSSCLGRIYPGYCCYLIRVRTCVICYFRSQKLLQAVVKGQDAVELQMVLQKECNSANSRAMPYK